MKAILQVFLFMMSIVSFAQQGINYKALIKDGSGNVVANSNVEIIFEIIDSQNTTLIYGETHTVSTDAYGIVIVNIGEGDATPGYTPFTDINWGEVNYSLRTYLNDGNETSYLGETQFKAVPYALHAETSGDTFSGDYYDLTNQPTITNPTGLEAINEGNGTGHRIIGRNHTNHGNIGSNAIDLSWSSQNGDYGATGLGSTATGFQTTASGDFSTAIGNVSTASGEGSITIGNFLSATGYSSTAIGQFNVGGGNTTSWVATDPLFEIGNGIGGNKSNALTVLKNGNVGIGTTAPIYPLQVTTRNLGVGDANPNHYLANTGVGENGTGWTYSIGATYGVWSGVGFSTSSDSRIKNIMGQSNSADDLSKLMKLEITDYQYIDVVNKGDEVTKKVIAQQVKEVLPNAVNYTVDFIPNIYQLVTMSKSKEGQTRLMFKEDPGVNENDILKFITENNAEVTARVISVLGNTVIVDSELKGKDNQIFVFGKRVNDFHTVDYDAISMLNVSATQEQQKLIETLQEKVQSLQKQNQALQAEANKILALEKDMLELKTMLLTKKEQTKITQN